MVSRDWRERRCRGAGLIEASSFRRALQGVWARDIMGLHTEYGKTLRTQHLRCHCENTVLFALRQEVRVWNKITFSSYLLREISGYMEIPRRHDMPNLDLHKSGLILSKLTRSHTVPHGS